jgi:hypothetical protein
MLIEMVEAGNVCPFLLLIQLEKQQQQWNKEALIF